MNHDLRLAGRLIRGGGRSGFVRLALMAGGMAVAVTAILTVAQLPAVLADRDAAIAARQPVPAAESKHPDDFTYLATQLSWEGASFYRVFVASTPDTPPPPGLERAPLAGEVALSPRAAVLARDPAFRALVPGSRGDSIKAEGLTEPQELVAYVGVDRKQIQQPSKASGWGVPSGADVAGTRQFRAIGFELAVLIVPAALVYLAACARLAAATRRRRFAALRLVGASTKTLQRLAYAEAAVSSVAGCVLGVGLFLVTDNVVARTAAIGIRWYPDRIDLNVPIIAGLIVVTLVTTRIAAWASTRRAVSDPLGERRTQFDRPTRWWAIIPLVLGLSLLMPWLPIGSASEVGPFAEAVLLLGAALSTVGVLLAARPVITFVAGRLTNTRLPLWLRLGAHRLKSDSSSAVRLVAGLALLILVSAIGTGITTSAEADAGSTLEPVNIHVYGSEVLPSQRGAVRDLNPDGKSWLTVASAVETNNEPDDGTPQWIIDHLGVRLLAATCPQLQDLTANREWACEPGQLYRVRAGTQPPVPSELTVPFLRDGKRFTVQTPPQAVDVAVDSDAATSQLIYADASAPGGWADDTIINYIVPPGLDSLDEFVSALARVAPTATANSSIDLSSIAAFRVHRASLSFGTKVAFGLGLLAALIALVDRNLERRRLVVDLVAIGTPARVIRGSQLTFAALPLLVLGLLAAAVGFLIANIFAAADTGTQQWSWDSLNAAYPLLLIGLAASAAGALITIGTTPRAEDFRRE